MRISVFSGAALAALLLALLAAAVADSGRAAPWPAQPSDDQTADALTQGNSAFAFDLYALLAADYPNANLLFSPYSVSSALAMAYAGARGDTEAQMAAALHFDLDQATLHPAFAALTADLTARAGEPVPGVEGGQRPLLRVANALWGQAGYSFQDAYLALLDEVYGAPLREVDFINDAEAARVMVNDWVAESTEDKIRDIVPPGAFTPLTRLVLANAVYFNASWATPFPEFLTAEAPFYTLDGGEVTVNLMNLQEDYLYAAGEGYQAVAVPYLGNEAVMLIFVPDAGTFADFEATLDADLLGETVGALELKTVNLSLPKFRYEFSAGLGGPLGALGMTDAFNPDRADFSGISAPEADTLVVSDVLHKAFIAVDEAGTEAAAATVMMFEATTALQDEPEIIELKIDRPFIYAIYDFPSGSALFLGRVLNPAVGPAS